jgi:hypothetical protein
MEVGGRQFATKGRHYRIKSVSNTLYHIIDDAGRSHSFSIEDLKNGCRWFKFNQEIIINKSIKKFSF